MLFAAEEGIALDQQVVDLFTGEQYQPAYESVNPSHLVPVLEDDGFRLTESSAILKYLAEKTGSRAYPSELKQRAHQDCDPKRNPQAFNLRWQPVRQQKEVEQAAENQDPQQYRAARATISEQRFHRHSGTVALRERGGLEEFIESFRPEVSPAPETTEEMVATTPESVALSKALKKQGFAFVGPTTMYALMEAIGIVDDHLVDCHRHGAGAA